MKLMWKNYLFLIHFCKHPLDFLNLWQLCFCSWEKSGVLWSVWGMVSRPCPAQPMYLFPKGVWPQALVIPCWGPLKSEPLEVDVCLCQPPPPPPSIPPPETAFSYEEHQMWPLSDTNISDTAWSGLCGPPPTYTPNKTTIAVHHHHFTTSTLRPGSKTTLGWSATPAYTCHKT